MALHGVAEECFRGSDIPPLAKPKIDCSTCYRQHDTGMPVCRITVQILGR
jgi:hypothetical protein